MALPPSVALSFARRRRRTRHFMPPRSHDDLRRLHFINALFAHTTGQDLYLAEQIKEAISFSLAEFESKVADHPAGAGLYDAMFNAAAATLLAKAFAHQP